MTTIAVDAMGGDHAPRPEVEGSVQAARQFGVRVLLVGHPSELRRELARHSVQGLSIETVPAKEVITMTDSPTVAFRKKKDSSAHVAARLVRQGEAEGKVSAGNTGAVMTVARFVLGTLPSVQRPALAAQLPNSKGGVTVMLDVGANVDSKVAHLVQFAVMGEIYYRLIFGVRRPKVALLSIGEEEMKGNELTRAATPLLKTLPIHFIGNVEGGDIYSGHADVIVCDGFIGNVALKVSEGLVDTMQSMLRVSLEATVTRKLGYVLSRRAYRDFRKRVDYSEYGGAPLLGVKGVSIICHGRSNANAIKNAIRVAGEFAAGKLNAKIEAELDKTASQVAAQ